MKKYVFLISLIFCLPVFAQSPVGAQNIEPQNVQPQNIQQSTQEAQPQEIEKPQQEVSNQGSPSAPQAPVQQETEATTFSTIMGILLTLLVFVPPFLGSIKTRKHS